MTRHPDRRYRAPWCHRTDSNVDELLNDALETLQLANHSGGDCILMQGQLDNELAAWREELSTGNPFATVVAQDIMEPFPALFNEDSAPTEVADALRHAHLPLLAYVNRDGQLARIATEVGGPAAMDRGSGGSARGEGLTQGETIPHNASFPEIYDAFSTRNCAALVVTAAEKPLGYITCEGFLSLIDPIDAMSFTHTDKSAEELAYLAVPSLASEVAVEPAGI